MMYIRKKDNTIQPFDINKVVSATSKSAMRALSEFSEDDIELLKTTVTKMSREYYESHNHEPIPIEQMHIFAEKTLDLINPDIAKQYRDYRNYKVEFSEIMDHVYNENQRIMYRGDQENSNMNSALVSTKRSLCYNVLEEELYKKFFLNDEELQAQNDGYIYIHDKSSRLDTMNCCLFDISNVLTGGFWFGNMWYSEPKSIDTMFDVVADITLSSAGQQYGGFTMPQFDEIAYPFILKSKKIYEDMYDEIASSRIFKFFSARSRHYLKKRDKWVNKKLTRDIEQGWQGFEYKFNTVACSRGDYPFIAVSLGNGKTKYHKMFVKAILRIHAEGQGKPGNKIPVVFPKITFLFDKSMHAPGMKYYDVFKEAIKCSAKTMYPDFLSLTGEGYIPEMYKKYGKIVSLMGCRASLSPWYKEGGMHPANEKDTPEFIGRFNIGAVTLNLPMIYQKSKVENKDFYEVLDYYLEMIRKLHIRTYEYIANMKASCNPLGFCEGGFYHGNLKPNDKIGLDFLKPMTASFGVTALNELEVLATGRNLHEVPTDQKPFSQEVMEYINDKVDEFKEEDGWLYAIYGTPAESLCGKQIKSFRAKYGIIPGVSDKEYTTNSFHCHVTADITPTEKQNREKKFWNLFNGGKIQYTKQLSYNLKAIEKSTLRAMDYGFYYGNNTDSMNYCMDCGYHGRIKLDEPCPKCGSMNIYSIDRMCGYLSISRSSIEEGGTRLNSAKMAEIRSRVSM